MNCVIRSHIILLNIAYVIYSLGIQIPGDKQNKMLSMTQCYVYNYLITEGILASLKQQTFRQNFD